MGHGHHVKQTPWLRRVAEALFGSVRFVRRLPETSGGGLIQVSTKVGGLKFLFRRAANWDPELLEVAVALVRRSDVVWDVGANVGLFSKAASFHAGAEGRVLSIEADLDAAALLQITALRDREDGASITVLPVAISATQGIVDFAIARRARASNAIVGFGSSQTGGIKEVRTMPCMTLDALLSHFPAPNVLKIDVEGAELLVLEGATQVLGQAHPRIYCEVSDGSVDAVCAALRAFGYVIHDADGFARGVRKPATRLTRNIVGTPPPDPLSAV